ncbi:thrombospondin type 3 repeat family protein [Teredinibacter turnerae T7901]|uniref:Thrombospondin type 3 repeat family protein n=1 Tax=Teredinibacter turnerae (strain ATCC 39867 / T7901) TaxID=377629 RepID=C5BQV0_TERTT|nr:putative Ig domain-containing protein [Teredinibacter turnerae]ACR12880.1 thrombospondin type 3 repeat family protein [Teredinibacter turnerae T7901]
MFKNWHLKQLKAAALFLVALTPMRNALADENDLVVIDPQVDEWQAMVSDLGDDTQVLMLKQGTNPFAQIRDALAARSAPVSRLHLVSHGAAGELFLGGQLIDSVSLPSYGRDLAEMGQQLTPGADWYVYGCDVAAGRDGEHFLTAMSDYSGLDVAASMDRTGASALGGNWTLEYERGEVQPQALFSARFQQQYQAVLSHFRGGSMSWRLVDADGDTQLDDLELTVKSAWRWNSMSPPSNSSLIVSGTDQPLTFVQTSDEVVYVNGEYNAPGDTTPTTADYALSTRTFTANDIPQGQAFLIRWNGGARISDLRNNADGNWNIQTLVNTSNGNLAPKIDLPIIYEVPQLQSDGVSTLQSYTFPVTSTDPNADKMRFRLATEDELGGLAGGYVNPTGFTINTNTGVVTWNDSGTLTPGLYSAGIVVEDVRADGTVISKSHVDFILDLQPKAAVPFEVSNNIPESRNVIVEKGDSYNFQITGTAVDVSSLGTLQGTLTESSTVDGDFTFAPGAIGTGLDPGTYPITFEIYDTSDARSKSYLILNFIVPDPLAPRLQNVESDTITYASTDAQLVDVDSDAILTDRDNGGNPVTHLNNGLLRFNVSFADGEYEVLGFTSEGDGPGQFRRDGYEIYYEGSKIADIDTYEDGVGNALRIQFGTVSTATVQALVRKLTYNDTFVLRASGRRNLSLYVQDGDGLARNYSLYVDVQEHPEKPATSGPVVVNNHLHLRNVADNVITSNDLQFADADTDPSNVTIVINSTPNGIFWRLGAPTVAITSFTQQEVNDGKIYYDHRTGPYAPPEVNLSATDGTTPAGPYDSEISFTSNDNSAYTLDENTTSVGLVPVHGESGTVTYSLIPYPDYNQGDLFNVNPNSGALSFKVAPDYENPVMSGIPNQYKLAVQVIGSASSGHVQKITVDVRDVNEAPVITGTPAASVRVPASYSFTPTATDPESDAISWSIANKPSWMSFDTSTGALSGSPSDSDVGSYTYIFIIASDGNLNSHITLDIDVVERNYAPVIIVEGKSTAENTPFSYTPTVADGNSGDVLTYSITNKPAWASFNTATGEISGTPGFDDAGAYNGIQITVDDANGGVTQSDAFQIFVTDTNRAPTISGTPATTGSEGVAYSFVPTGFDPDGDRLAFSVLNLPPWASFDDTTGTVSGAPGFTDSGTYSNIIVGVNDLRSGVDTLPAFSIVVAEVNRAPTLSGTPAVSVAEDASYSFAPVVNDPDTDNTLTLSITNKPSWASFNTTTGALTGKPGFEDAGTYSGIVISVVDNLGEGNSLPAFTITVTNTNRAPTITGVPATSVTEASNYSFVPSATELDSSDSVSGFSITNKPAWASFNPTTGELSGTPGYEDAGSYNGIVISVTDTVGGTSSLPAFSITVADLNREPVISALPPGQPIAEAETYTYAATATDADSDILTYSIVNKPSWASFNTATGVLTGTPGYDDAGRYDGIVIEALDGKGGRAAVGPFGIQVQNTNRLPTISGTPLPTIAEGQPYSFTVSATDPDTGARLSYRGEYLPSWLSVDPTTGTVTGTPGYEDAGTYANVAIIVEDELGGRDTLGPFAITVTDTNRAPTIAGTAPGSTDEGGSFYFTPTASDPDSDPLTFAVSNKPSWAQFNSNTGVLSGTPGYLDAGQYAGITVTVSDGRGGSAVFGPFSVDVNNLNRAPTISGTAAPKGTEKLAYSFTPSVVDPDTDDVHTFSVTNKPAWASFNTATGMLSGTPQDGDEGTYSGIVISVDDGKGGSDALAPFAIQIDNDNTAPVASGISANIVEDQPYEVTITAQDGENDPLTFIVVDQPEHGTLTGTGPKFVYTPNLDYVGADQFTFRVSDGELQSDLTTASFNVEADLDGDKIIDDLDSDVDGDGIPNAEDGSGDSDDDGIIDSRDTDSDNDGIPDSVEGAEDQDQDGIPNHQDLDSDGDNLPDALEGTVDSDEDGTPDYLDTDSDNDGISDLIEGAEDSDKDGTPDYLDSDSDNDGISDKDEGADDIDNDGIPNYLDDDADNDGMKDADEGTADSDGDGTPDYLDTDSDNDGISDKDEGATDSDNDGTPDYLDTDSDNDGISDKDEGADDIDNDGIPNYRDDDSDNDGMSDKDEGSADSDNDGTPDYLDSDSDNDGISDKDEGSADSDNDGLPDYLDSDSDNDGISDKDEGSADSDNDGTPNYRDEDSDGDGIPDADESQADSDGDNIPDFIDTDSDNDGISDSEEGARDSDNDGVSDYLDTDSDNDGIDDKDESTGDSDGDGTPDYLDTSIDEDGDGIPDIIEGAGDDDGDGIPNYADIDSDNDGILDNQEEGISGKDSDNDGIDDSFDVDETGGVDLDNDGIDDGYVLRDTDEDGIPDMLDPDSDGDGIPDALEAVREPVDSDNDLIDDRFDVDQTGGIDTDGNGIDDRFDAGQTGGPDADNDGIDDTTVPQADADHDGIPDYLDSDSDNDGIPDSVEAGNTGNDTDGDGIDDQYDADFTGGADLNGDGVDDDAALRDSDGDGIPDLRDLDSDNDGFFDVDEAGYPDLDENGMVDDESLVTGPALDSDNDGIPDYLDLDSNNDGINDIEGNAAHVLDEDGDGRIDNMVDSDQDGIHDLLDQQPNAFGSGSDKDHDSVPAGLDRDQDGDGISDAVEGMGDLDNDGLADALDLDSDNDGLPDSLETDRPAPTGVDTDFDGIDDAYDVDVTGGVDADGDGVDDRFQEVDTDGDGLPDYRDLDSDNDGIPDSEEQLLVPLTGMDSDSDGIDDAVDVDNTGGVDANNDGVDDALVVTTDFDNDGLPDYRDTDSDNDGVLDGDENGDFNNDGIVDRLQVDNGVETGVNGGGSFGLWLLMMMGALVLVKRRASRPLLVVALLLASVAGRAAECDYSSAYRQAGCWYLGLGAGVSKLEPEPTDATSWQVNDSSSNAVGVFAGLRLSDHLFAELSHYDLGTATLSSVNPSITLEPEIDYSITGLSAGYWLRNYGARLNAFVKVGLQTLDTTSTNISHQNNSTQFTLGVGGEWLISEKWFARVSLDSYDKDAQAATLSVARYLGKASPKPAKAEPVAAAPADADNDGVIDADDQCPQTPEGVAVNHFGCPEISPVTVHFAFNSAVLSAETQAQLDALAQGVAAANYDFRVKIAGHADWVGSEAFNQGLSEKRANAVANYLSERLQLNAEKWDTRGYGEVKPVADNNSAQGRAQNRRVEITFK